VRLPEPKDVGTRRDLFKTRKEESGEVLVLLVAGEEENARRGRGCPEIEKRERAISRGKRP